MNSKSLATAKRLFEQNKSLDKVFSTTDEQVFEVENHAWNNARSLDKAKPLVNTILRKEVITPEPVVDEDAEVVVTGDETEESGSGSSDDKAEDTGQSKGKNKGKNK